MARWSRGRSYVRQNCVVCGEKSGTRLCDGVISRSPWRLCNRPLCEGHALRRGRAADFCPACAMARGYATREAGEEG
jgi:hypothetical protein